MLADLFNHEVVAAIIAAIGAIVVAVITVNVGRLRRENREQHGDVHDLVSDVRDLVLRNEGRLDQIHRDNEQDHQRIIGMIQRNSTEYTD